MTPRHISGKNTAGTLLSFPFRIFFLLVALYAALIIPLWLCVFFLGRPVVSPVPIFLWHAHELLFGVVAAAIAGFMLTAICTWTGCRPLTGLRLAFFVCLWLVGRLAFLAPGIVGLPLLAFFDLLFLACLFVYVALVIVQSRNWRNLPMPGILVLLFAANAVMHWGMLRGDYLLADKGKLLALDIVALMIAFVGGRIIPAFTANWLAGQGQSRDRVKNHMVLDMTSLAALALILPADLFLGSNMQGVIAALAGLLLLARLTGWQGWLCRDEPLLWILHLGYLWLTAALLLKGLAPFIAVVTPSVWSHVLGIGAIGTMILGVMTRVALGHTGRPLRLPRWSVASYWLITLAAVCRLIYGLGLHPTRLVLVATGVAWSAAFVVFLVTYWPILGNARVDGSGQA